MRFASGAGSRFQRRKLISRNCQAMQLEHEQALKASSDAFGTRRRAVEDHVDGIRQAEEARREHALEDGAFWGFTHSNSMESKQGRKPRSGSFVR